MPISALRKLLQLITPKSSLEEEKLSEEISEQKTENDLVDIDEETQEMEMQNAECEQQKTTECCFLPSECAETRSNANEACPQEQNDYVSRDKNETMVNHPESNRSHLTSSVPRAAKAPLGTLTKGELAEIRNLFANMDDLEIQRLYKKVTK